MTGAVWVHRLGMASCLAVAVLCMGSAIASGVRRRATRRRIGSLLRVRAARRGPLVGPRTRARVVIWAWPAGALVAGWVLVGGVTGVLVGCGAAYGVRRLRSRAGPPVGVDPREVERQLPFAADLLAACLAAGAGPVEAAEVVGESLGGPVGERLALAGAELRLGGEPGTGWGGWRRYRAPGNWRSAWNGPPARGHRPPSRSPAWRRPSGRTGPDRPRPGHSGPPYSSPHPWGCVSSPHFLWWEWLQW